MKYLTKFFIFGLFLFLFALSAQADDYYVRDYGAKGDGATNDKTAIQMAIDAAANAGGGNVVLDGNKIYLTGGLRLKSNVSLIIEAGSKLKSSSNIWDFEPNTCTEDSAGNCHCGDLIAPIIFADQVNNISVRGGGTIVGFDDEMRGRVGKACSWEGTCHGNPPTAPSFIFFGDVSGGTIRDLIFEKTAGPGILLVESDNITLDNIKVLNRTDGAQCNDALDIFSSQHITVKSSEFTSADDAIALKVDWGIYAARHMMSDINLEYVDDILIENNTVYAPSGGHGLQIGAELVGGVSNVIWRNNIIRTGTNLPAQIELWEQNENTSIHDIYYDNNKMENGNLITGSNIPVSYPDHECVYYDIFVNKDSYGDWIRHPSDRIKTVAVCEEGCSCVSWQNQGCGQSGCSSNQMLQARTCAPASCNIESQCIAHSSCTQLKKGDLNNDNKVDVIDLGIFLSNWGKTTKPPADINQDGKVDVIDLGILLSNWQS